MGTKIVRKKKTVRQRLARRWTSLKSFSKAAWSFQPSPKAWFSMAIFSFIGAIAVIAVAAVWVLRALHNEPLMVQRAQAFTPFGAGLVGVVSFLTIAWRGVLATEQVRQQTRQNDANDAANYAKLLQEGAKLIGETKNDAHVLAGIATLSIVINDPHIARYQTQAMDLIAGYLVTAYGDEKLGNLNKAAISALREGERVGIMSKIEGRFTRGVGARERWARIPGIATITYEGGRMTKPVFNRLTAYADDVTLRKVRVEDVILDGTAIDFDKCEFVKCKIRTIGRQALMSCTFEECDFSKAEIRSTKTRLPTKDLTQGGNWYNAEEPPTGADAHDWASQLIRREGQRQPTSD